MKLELGILWLDPQFFRSNLCSGGKFVSEIKRPGFANNADFHMRPDTCEPVEEENAPGVRTLLINGEKMYAVSLGSTLLGHTMEQRPSKGGKPNY